MAERLPTKRKTKHGMRALEACGEGFWEFDLINGSAWFNDWFHRKLDWPQDSRHTTLGDLRPALPPGTWNDLMARFRAHLEKGLPLDLEIDVQAADKRECWHLKGSAVRNNAGQPIFLAGSMREVETPRATVASLRRLEAAFDALPVGAALLDARATVLAANRRWQALPPDTARAAIAQAAATKSDTDTGIAFRLDAGAAAAAGARPLLARAIGFEHEGARYLVLTLEERAGD
jgi:hypothetical protein